jgi:hypothetical protein
VSDSPAYGTRNVSMVAAGTGEALPGPVACGFAAGASRPITDDLGKWREGPLLRRCAVSVLEGPGECPRG